MRDDAMLSLPSSSRSTVDESSIPSYFICPISQVCDLSVESSQFYIEIEDRVLANCLCAKFQDVMNDPHIAADGFTYEGELIRSWLSTGSDTSPMTNLPLEHDELIPNLALRSAIQEWHQQQNRVLQ
jgi:hypothetical protein